METVWRLWCMLRACDEFDMPATTSLSLALLEEQPELREAMFERNWEIMSHGISNLRPLYGYTKEQEDEFFCHLPGALKDLLRRPHHQGHAGPAHLRHGQHLRPRRRNTG